MRRALGTIALAVALAACGNGNEDAVITASGQVEATDVRISAKVGGRIQSFGVDEGDRVDAGREIVAIDPTDLRLALQQAEAEGRQAKAELRLREAGARAEDIAEMKAQIARVRVEREAAERDRQRMQELLDRGSGTTKARDDARTRRDALDAQLQAMSESLHRLEKGSRPQEIDAATARVAALEAKAAQIRQQIADATVTSPIAGIVTEKLAEAGEIVAAGAPLAIVTDLADAWVDVYVAEPDLGRIRIGQEVEVVTDDGQTRKGTIATIASKAEFTPRNVQTRDERVRLVFRVKIALDNDDGLFKPGMPATARIAPVTAS